MSPESEEMRPEYNFRGGVRGKFYRKHLGTVRFQDSPWVQRQESVSEGEHASQSTIQIVAEPVYRVPHLEVSEPVH